MRTNIPIRFIKLEDGYHLLVRLKVNGRSARLLIDTGASHTVFDKMRIERLLEGDKMEKHDKLSTGLGTNSMKSQLATLRKIEMGKVVLKNFRCVVIDLSHVNHAYAQLRLEPVDGVLGSEVLKKYKAVIDYGKRILILG